MWSEGAGGKGGPVFSVLNCCHIERGLVWQNEAPLRQPLVTSKEHCVQHALIQQEVSAQHTCFWGRPSFCVQPPLVFVLPSGGPHQLEPYQVLLFSCSNHDNQEAVTIKTVVFVIEFCNPLFRMTGRKPMRRKDPHPIHSETMMSTCAPRYLEIFGSYK